MHIKLEEDKASLQGMILSCLSFGQVGSAPR
jgi:hypothetical protein